MNPVAMELSKKAYGALSDNREEMPSAAVHSLQRVLGPYPNEDTLAKMASDEEFSTKEEIQMTWEAIPEAYAAWLAEWTEKLPTHARVAFENVLKTEAAPAQ